MLPSMTVTQQYLLTLSPTNRRGQPAPVQPGSITWGSSNDAVAQVNPDVGNENQAMVVAQGVGTYTITATADADLGEGVTTITGSDSGEVTPGTAVSVGLVAGPVQEQP